MTQVGTDSEGEIDEIFFIWPTTLVRRISFNIFFKAHFSLQVHKIDSESPFYSMSARDFLKKRYEIVVLLEGVIEQTGNSIQVTFNKTSTTAATTMIKRSPPRLGRLTFPTRCCGVTASSTYSTSSIPSPSTKSTTLHSTQFIGGRHS